MQFIISTDFLMYWFAIGMWICLLATAQTLKKYELRKEGKDDSNAEIDFRKEFVSIPAIVICWGGGGVLVNALWQSF